MDIITYGAAVNKAKSLITEAQKIGFKISVVDKLPSSGENYILYLVPNGGSVSSNIYNEYVWANNKFEMVGSTAIELDKISATDLILYIEGA